MKVKATVYKGYLVIETLNPRESHPDFTPAGDGKLGCVINNTKENLGLSAEAVEFLQNVQAGNDAIGDLMWFPTNEGGTAFGWMGGPYSLKNAQSIGDRDFKVQDGQYQTIPNETTEGARQAIDDASADPIGSLLRALGLGGKLPPGLLGGLQGGEDGEDGPAAPENCGNPFCPVHGYGDPTQDYDANQVVFAVFTDEKGIAASLVPLKVMDTKDDDLIHRYVNEFKLGAKSLKTMEEAHKDLTSQGVRFSPEVVSILEAGGVKVYRPALN
jgi:hypothetical protein